MDVTIEIQATVREADGLAMSSRNAYLMAGERKAAPIVYQSLCRARELFERADDCIASEVLIAVVKETLKSEALVSEVQYVAVDSKETMLALDRVSRREGAIISLACKLGSVRLIDNLVL
jgi:pantoate--beta-alanine ligase